MAASTVSLPYNRHVLIWARERLGIDQEAAAKRAHVGQDRLAQWESGERNPTVKQARKLASFYGRPFLEFFATNIPDIPEVDLVPDYRLCSDHPSKGEAIALTEVQRWAEEQRINALDLFEIIAEQPPSFPKQLFADLESDLEETASSAREAIGFDIENQISIKSGEKYKLPKIIRHHIERVGVLVLKLSGLKKLRTRGICFYANPLPTIVFGNESPGAQAFTLAHEFGHILLRNSAISGPPRSNSKSKMEIKKIEDWCNDFAASFLMPEQSIEKFVKKPAIPSPGFDDTGLKALSRKFGVSTHAMLIRLVNLGFVEPDHYWKVKRPIFIKEEEEYTGGGLPEYYGSRYVNNNGDLYTSLVLEAWGSGRITNHNAAEFMGIKNLSHLDDIQQRFGR